jgi:hypothetical protein
MHCDGLGALCGLVADANRVILDFPKTQVPQNQQHKLNANRKSELLAIVVTR